MSPLFIAFSAHLTAWLLYNEKPKPLLITLFFEQSILLGFSSPKLLFLLK